MRLLWCALLCKWFTNEVAYCVCRSREVDPSAAVLWLLAVSTAVAAALWAGSDFAFEAKYTRSTFDDEVS